MICPYVEAGEAVRERRRQRGLSIRELAESMKCSPAFLMLVESGASRPSVDKAKALCDALDLSLSSRENLARVWSQPERNAIERWNQL